MAAIFRGIDVLMMDATMMRSLAFGSDCWKLVIRTILYQWIDAYLFLWAIYLLL